MTNICRVDDCLKPKHKGRTLCSMHANRWARHKSLDKPKPRSQAGENGHNWKGDMVGYHGAHDRLRARRPASELPCVGCGDQAYDWAYDHRCPNEKRDGKEGPYSTDPSHYQPMCRPCHRSFDYAVSA